MTAKPVRDTAAAQAYCDARNKLVDPNVEGVRGYFVKDGRVCVEMMPVEFILKMREKRTCLV